MSVATGNRNHGTPPSAPLSHRTIRLLLLAAIIAAAALRFYGISAKSLWGDEIISTTVSVGYSWYPWNGEETAPFYSAAHYRERATVVPGYFSQRLVSLLIDDQNAPFYFALLNVWLHVFGTSEAALRSLSLLASVASIPLLYLLCRELGGRQAGIYAAWLFALAPFQVAFGIYNRPYAWLGLFTILSSLGAVHLSRGKGGRWFLVYAIAATLGAYTHYLFVWCLAFQAILVIGYQRRNTRFLLRFGLVCLAVAGVCLLWLPTFLEQLRWSRELGRQTWFYWYSGRSSLTDTALSLGRNGLLLLTSGSVTGFGDEGAGGRINGLLTAVFYAVPLSVAAVCAGRLLQHIRHGDPTRSAIPDPWITCLLWAGFVFAGPTISDLVLESRMVSSHRYFIGASAPVYLAASIAIMGMRSPFLRRGMGAGLLLFALAGSLLYLRGSSNGLMHEIDVREVGRHLERQSAGTDDLILVLDPGVNPVDVAYYLRSNPDFARVEVPERHKSVPDIGTQLQMVLNAKARTRIWYLDDHGPETRANDALLGWLRAHYEEIDPRAFTNVDLFEFRPRGGSADGERR